MGAFDMYPGRTYKVQQFLSSGMFIPSPGLISAGGAVDVLYLVGGGAPGGSTSGAGVCGGGAGGQVIKDAKITILNPILVTIAAATTCSGGNQSAPTGADSSIGGLLVAYGGGSPGSCGAAGALWTPVARWGVGGDPIAQGGTQGAGSGAGAGGPATQISAAGVVQATPYNNSPTAWTALIANLKGGYFGTQGSSTYFSLGGQGIDGFGRGGPGGSADSTIRGFAYSGIVGATTGQNGANAAANTGDGGGGAGAGAGTGGTGASGYGLLGWWE